MINVIPRVAVCLAAYNGIRWLPEQLASILAQVQVDIQVFISVDMSSDGTEAWVNQAAQNDSRITVLKHGVVFGGAARNFFRLLKDIDFTNFDYVALADQDDIWFLDKLIRAHYTLIETQADAYSSNVMALWPDGQTKLINKSQSQVRWDFLFEAAGPGCTYVMRIPLVMAVQKALLSEWEMVQKISLHDWFVYAFARANCYVWIIDSRPGMLYRQHDCNQVGVNVGWRAHMRRLSKIRGHFGLSQSRLIANIVGLADDPFVKMWSKGGRIGKIQLALKAAECRRSLRDKIAFAFICLIIK